MTRMKTKTPRSNVRTKKADDPVAITTIEYGGLQAAFDHLNRVLFDGKLPDAFITYQRKPHMRGHFSDDRYSARVGEFKKPELALNPDEFIGRSDEQIVSTLGHEMTHLKQHRFGKPSSRGYHNKEFARMMKEIGLMPSNTGAVGGKETGQQMSHYVIPGGAYQRAFAELAGGGWKLNLQSTICAGGSRKKNDSKTTFTCPVCEANAWGKASSGLVCKACLIGALAGLGWIDEAKAQDLAETIQSVEMRASTGEPEAVASYDQAAE